jgi:hypothetical protein
MDISATLIALLQGHPWSASAVTVIGVVGFVLTHVLPMLPVPAQGATGTWPMIYKVWTFLAGNWGNQATPQPPPKA